MILLGEGPGLDRSIDLVRRDVQEPGHPDPPGRVAEDTRSITVRSNERIRARDRAIDVALGGKVHNRVVAFHGGEDRVSIADIPLDVSSPVRCWGAIALLTITAAFAITVIAIQ